MNPVRVETVDAMDWAELLDTSLTEGHGMVERLLRDFRAGTNRFDAAGEALFVHVHGGTVVAVAGLNREPDAHFGTAGRVRRLYVAPRVRGRGLARSLVEALETRAAAQFDALTANVGPSDAHGFYEHLGFTPVAHPGITHVRSRDRRTN